MDNAYFYGVLLSGLLLISLIVFLKIKKSGKPTQQQRKGTFFQSSNGQIFFTRRGSNKKGVILLLHGIGASGYCWRLLIPYLEDQFEIINVDLLGFGRSDKPQSQHIDFDLHCKSIQELASSLKIKSFHIAGCSMGGGLALYLSIAQPKMVQKVIALAPATDPVLVPKILPKMSWISKWTHLFINKKFIEQLLLNIYHDKTMVTPDVVNEYFRPYRSNKEAHRSFANHLSLLHKNPVHGQLNRITTPTLVLWGENDRLVRKKTMQQTIELIPNVQWQFHPYGGHHLMEEDPQWCHNQLKKFILEI